MTPLHPNGAGRPSQGFTVCCTAKAAYEHPATDPPTPLPMCPACHDQIEPGQAVALVFVGCGKDAEQRRLARFGMPFSPVGILQHFACIAGDETPAAGAGLVTL